MQTISEGKTVRHTMWENVYNLTVTNRKMWNYTQEHVSHYLLHESACHHKCHHTEYLASVIPLLLLCSRFQQDTSNWAMLFCFSVAFFRPSRQIPGQYRKKKNHDRLLSQPFPITAYARVSLSLSLKQPQRRVWGQLISKALRVVLILHKDVKSTVKCQC